MSVKTWPDLIRQLGPLTDEQALDLLDDLVRADPGPDVDVLQRTIREAAVVVEQARGGHQAIRSYLVVSLCGVAGRAGRQLIGPLVHTERQEDRDGQAVLVFRVASLSVPATVIDLKE